MRVPSRQISTDNKVKQTQQATSVKAGLKVGKRFAALIVSVDGENISLEVNGKLINARNASSEKLFTGSTAQFEVLKSNDETIEIRPIALSNLSSAENDYNFVKSTLNKLGINFTSDNAEVLAQMLKTGVPVSKTTFMENKQAFFSSQKLADMLFNTENNSNNQAVTTSNNSLVNDAKSLIDLIATSSKDIITNKEALSVLKDFVDKNIDVSSFPKNDVAGAKGQEQQAALKISDHPTESSKSVGSSSQNVNNSENINAKPANNLVKNFMESFKNISSNRENLVNHIVFLSKSGIKPSIFNLAISDSLMNGKLGLSKSMSQTLAILLENPSMIENKELNTKLTAFLKNTLDISELPDKLDAKSVEENLKTFKLLSDELTKLEVENKSGKDVEQLTLLKQNASLVKEMEPVWQNVFMPMISKNNINDIEMYIKKDGSNSVSKRNSDDRVIYLSLKTDNIERVKTRIDYSKKDLKLIFLMQDEALKTYAETMIDSLKSRLSTISNKKIHIAVNADSFDTNLLDFELVTSFKPSSNIDMRV